MKSESSLDNTRFYHAWPHVFLVDDKNLEPLPSSALRTNVLSAPLLSGAGAETLPLFLRDVAKRLITTRIAGNAAFANEKLVVKAFPVAAAVPAHAIVVGSCDAAEMLEGAARRFGLSSREQDVLKLALDGKSTAQIAGELSIASSTAADHLRRLIMKSGSSNRSGMIAKMLGWQSSP